MTKLSTIKAKAKRQGWDKWIRPGDADERALLAGYYFDVEAGKHAVEFFQRFLFHTMGQWAGQPFKLLPWQRDDVIMPLFGWMRPDGNRRFAKGDIFVAKKQGKSTLSAGIACYFLTMGGDRTEVFGLAHTRDQAGIIYREAAAMVRSSPELAKRLKVRDSQKRIMYPDKQSFYVAVAGENNARGIEGINPNLILFDEIHVQRSRALYDALTYASSARANSLMLSVSTVGVADSTTIWWEQYEYARGVIDGSKTDHTRFAYITQADEECKDDKKLRNDPRQWRKAMPSLGVTVTEDKVRDAVAEAENSPAKLNNLLRYLFNVPTAQVTRVVPMESWDECLITDEPRLDGRPCYGGLDVASSEDLTAYVLYWPPDGDEPGYLKSWFWCPEAKIRQREHKQLAHYGQWVKSGELLETDGNRIDHAAVSAVIRETCQEYDVREIGFDQWNADAVANPLISEGVKLVSVSQSYAGMSTGTKALLDAIAAKGIAHDGNAVMRWCLANCAADTRDEAIRFSKQKSADKIDGAVAAAIAFGRALAGQEAAVENPYDDRGLYTL